MLVQTPRIIIAGLAGDSGKTFVSLGLASAFAAKGKEVRAFKKGPDYIDAAWLTLAAKHEATNLDTYLMGEEKTRSLFAHKLSNADIAIIEGNRGLHDGSDVEGTHSTASLAKSLQTPVILVVDATKATRTLAALVLGAKVLDSDCPLAGVILNRVGGKRHLKIAKEAIARYANVPVVGAIGKLDSERLIPSRHLGLWPVDETQTANRAIDFAAETLLNACDFEAIWAIAKKAPHFEAEPPYRFPMTNKKNACNIGLLTGGAFSFYYPENLQALIASGANITKIDAINESSLGDIDALYIGGGFPETHAEALCKNDKLRNNITSAAKGGMPIYAECGGLMYLSQAISWRGSRWPMCGVLPFETVVHDKPQGHGYSQLAIDTPNPFFTVGQALTGHEFHYSTIFPNSLEGITTAARVKKGAGVHGKRDGVLEKNTIAFYTHLHAVATEAWAKGLVNAAKAAGRARSITKMTMAQETKLDGAISAFSS